MTTLKASACLIGATLARALNGLAVLKVLAVHTSPTDFGQLAQIMGVIALSGMLAAGGIGNGLTRQLAASQSELEQSRWLLVALKIYLVASVLLAVLLLAGAWSLARWLLEDIGYTPVFVALAAGQALVGASTLSQAVAAARGNYGFILRIAGIGAVVGVLVVGVGVWLGGVVGGALALVINAALPGLVAIAIKRQALAKLAGRVGERVARSDIALLLNYAGIAMLGAASLTVSQIASRNLVGKTLGWDAVGFWQAVARISDVYMQLISIALMSYVLPKLSRIDGFKSMHPELLRLTGALCATFLFAAMFIYSLREFLISLLFSVEYLPAAGLLPIQLLGDLFRLIAVCLSVALIARGLTRTSMIYETVQGILTFALTAALLDGSGISAPLQAYCLTYAILMAWLLWVYLAQLRYSGSL